MGELKNIKFNPETGLFEDCTNPTAHLTQGELRKARRQRHLDPMALQMKPVIRSVYVSGGARPKEGTTIEMSWFVENAQRVSITFPSGKKVDFPPACRCQFVVPGRKSQIRLIAYNGKCHTQRTFLITPKRIPLLLRLLKWCKTHLDNN
jgi:hypothetical protein